MNHFLNAMLKSSFLVFAVLGVSALGVGVMLALFPEVLLRILRWCAAAALLVGGAVLFCGGLYGSISAIKLNQQEKQ